MVFRHHVLSFSVVLEDGGCGGYIHLTRRWWSVRVKQFAEAFYGSDAWKQCRIAYKKSVGGLCEICRRNGLIKAGEIVHHKVHLNPVNINDPNVTLNWNNLELVCRDCHAAEHGNKKRYKVDADGKVVAR